MEWLAWYERLEKVWPCAAPFLLGLCLSALLRWLFLRSMRREKAAILAEVRAQWALLGLSEPPKTSPANGSAKPGSGGASS